MQLSSGAFKGLRFAGALLLCGVLTALGLVYWRSIEQQEQYLSGRNFRFLTVLAEQTEAMIVGQGRILQGALRDRQYLASKPAATWSSWLKEPDMVLIAGTTDTVFWAGIGLPVCAWLMTFVALNRPREVIAGPRRRMEPILEYRVAVTLFLVVTAMVPGMAFVARSYDLHMESYVKEHQLGIAKSLAERRATGEDRNDLGLYFRGFNETQVGVRLAVDDGRRAQHAPHHDVVLSLLEEYLPYFADASVERRELMHDHADDGSWVSERSGGRLQVTVGELGANKLVLASTLPSVFPFGTTPSAVSVHRPLFLTAYAAPSFLIGVVGLAYMIVVFIMRHVFLSQVTEPLWASTRLVATSGDNLLVMCDPPAMAGRIEGASVVELGAMLRDPHPNAAWRRVLMDIGAAGIGGAIVVTDIDNDLDDLELTYGKLALLEQLVSDTGRTIVVLSKNPPAILADSVRRAQQPAAGDRERWTRMFRAFVVLDWRDTPVVTPLAVSVQPPPATGWRRFVPRLRFSARASLKKSREALLAQEGAPDRFLQRICDDIRQSEAFTSGFLSGDQILDEIEERASGYYRKVWTDCSDDEKVVLGHVADVGLTNAASRRVVRRLLVRRLLSKDPDLRLMNRTFRTFVLLPANRAVVAQLEGMREASTWDRLRLPLVVAAGVAGVFLYNTQRDVFTSTAAIVAGVTTAVPMVVRAVTMLTQKQSPGSEAATRDA